MTSRLVPHLRRLLILCVAFAVIEGLARVADSSQHFRMQLLGGLDSAAYNDAQEDPLWENVDRPFDRAVHDHAQALRFRPHTSQSPTGEGLDPNDIPPGKRVFVLGESAAFGVGVKANETFAALLDARLGPQGVHVINAGQTGADPWQVLDAGAQLLTQYSPSTLILFTGNNQWIYWLPPQQRRWNPQVLSILRALSDSRALAWLELTFIHWTLAHSNPEKTFADHAEKSGADYALAHPLKPTPAFGPGSWPPVKALYLQRYGRSLETLISHAKAAGTKVVLITMPFNYKLSPAWKHPQFEAIDPAHALEVARLLHDAADQLKSGRSSDALATTDRALAMDPLPPALNYVRAEALEKLGRLDESEAAYARSRELMLGNLGSRLSVNDTIRSVAAKSQVPLVDAAKLFDDDEHSRGHHFNEDLIIDDCHPSPRGHQLIADAVAPLL